MPKQKTQLPILNSTIERRREEQEFAPDQNQGGAAAVARHRHGLEVEDEGLIKDLIAISIFLGVLCVVCCFF
jgi:hypothetical protein